MNNQILAEEVHQPMYDVRRCHALLLLCSLLLTASITVHLQELSNKSDVQFIPGGATQNSMRIAQWLLQVPGAASYFGCVGKDKYAKIMEDTAKREGLNVSPDITTGMCSRPSGLCQPVLPQACMLHRPATWWTRARQQAPARLLSWEESAPWWPTWQLPTITRRALYADLLPTDLCNTAVHLLP